VYVDEPVNKWRGKIWCHLFAVDIGELHAFAKRLGLKREWFQDDPRLPHYDVTEHKRRIALRLGAVGVSRRVTYEHIQRNRAKVRSQSDG
jgi:hypothetical protein